MASVFPTISRRAFLASSAALGVSSALPALGLADASEHQTALDSAYEDSLRALGERIAGHTVAQLEAHGHPVTVDYLDCAAPTLSMLREGLARGFGFAGCPVRRWRDACADASPVVARLTIQDVATGRVVAVAIEATALSQLALIEEASASSVVAKQAIFAAEAASLYRIERIP
ncbi:MAG: hypothetical protein NZ533_07515 [Casimicrobiaceae bacterium]|nr:hypothetical protein [Casimicrobiaceae bacterium]